MMTSIVFYWVGNDITVPSLLVKSIRLIMGESQEIVQLTDKKTPAIPFVTNVQRFEVSPFILFGRLEAYAQVKTASEKIFFCDADSLFINPLEIDFKNHNLLLAERKSEDMFKFINYNYPEYYPEFLNKKNYEVMPFITGAIAMNQNRKDLFISLLEIYKKLPARFHRWYGDQYALGLMKASGNLEYGRFDFDKHHSTVDSVLPPSRLAAMKSKGVQMITFKGMKNKYFIEPTLENLEMVLRPKEAE